MKKTKEFKANVTVGKYNKERILYCRGETIMDALDITRKVRATKVNYIVPITHEEYLKGVKNA
jgi:hypothetical protein